jgi:Fe-Mn family superoxide dismutase
MHNLPPLAYSFDALEPHIDAATMEIHYSKHHQAYIDKLNAALAGKDDVNALSVDDLLKDLANIPQDIKTAIQNHGGGHANHSLFWDILTPGGTSTPSGELLTAIEASFTSFDGFKDALTQAALNQFGSGWAWLVVDNGELQVYATANQDSPLMQGHTPILGLDVWEHAYYLNYQNRRADYVSAWWNVVNWDKVAERFAQA